MLALGRLSEEYGASMKGARFGWLAATLAVRQCGGDWFSGRKRWITCWRFSMSAREITPTTCTRISVNASCRPSPRIGWPLPLHCVAIITAHLARSKAEHGVNGPLTGLRLMVSGLGRMAGLGRRVAAS